MKSFVETGSREDKKKNGPKRIIVIFIITLWLRFGKSRFSRYAFATRPSKAHY